jgi:hypothetical protein
LQTEYLTHLSPSLPKFQYKGHGLLLGLLKVLETLTKSRVLLLAKINGNRKELQKNAR